VRKRAKPQSWRLSNGTSEDFSFRSTGLHADGMSVADPDRHRDNTHYLEGIVRRIIAVGMVVAATTAACGGAAEPTTTESPTTTASVADQTTSTQPATTTTVSVTTTVAEPAEAGIVPGGDANADEIVALYALVFDGSTTFDEKAPLITDPDGLEATVDAYATASETVGGIALEVRSVTIGSDSADVVYDLVFAGSAFQTDQVGTAVSVDGSWKVSREYFCSIMQLARVGCS
jgi:hypothetical protein